MQVPPPFCSARAQLGFRHCLWLGGHGLPMSIEVWWSSLEDPRNSTALHSYQSVSHMFIDIITPYTRQTGIFFGFSAGETEAWCSCSKLLQVSQWVILQTNRRERGDAVMLHSGLWWADSKHQSCVVCTQRLLLSSGHTLISPTARGGPASSLVRWSSALLNLLTVIFQPCPALSGEQGFILVENFSLLMNPYKFIIETLWGV